MENENQDPKMLSAAPKPNHGKSVVIGMLSAFLILSWLFTFLMISKLMAELESKHGIILKEMTDNGNCVYKRDSLTMELNRLAIYKSLTGSMVYRDEAVMGLRHKVGDIAYAKRDSAQVVISDIIIGGSKYEYYVKYRIIRKDNTSEEVIPELVY